MSFKSRLRLITPRRVKRPRYRSLARHYINQLPLELDPSKPTILVINHYFDQDVRALHMANTDYNIVTVDGPELFKGGKIYCSDRIMRLEAPYDELGEKERLAFREDCREIFHHLRRRCDFRVIVTASDNFWWIREFILVAREHGIKTVVMDKEGTRTPYAFEGETKRIRDFAPFMSDHIFVWSERQRRFWRQTGVSDDNITVIGQPRSDLFHIEQTNHIDNMFTTARPLITLFSYEDTAYIPPYIARQRNVSWQQMKEETHDFIFRLAGEARDFNFVIKTHPQQSDLIPLQRYQRDNLAVIGGSSVANELIQRSELIIGFQTTALIEAMSFDKRIIYTAWDPLFAELADDLLPFHAAAGIVSASSLKQFSDVCRRFVSGDDSDFQFSPDDIAARRAFADEYFHRPDGHVSERFFHELGKFVAP
jgi:hypothetical protein